MLEYPKCQHINILSNIGYEKHWKHARTGRPGDQGREKLSKSLVDVNAKDKDLWRAKHRIYERLRIRQKLGVISISERLNLCNQIKDAADLEEINRIEEANRRVFRLLQGGPTGSDGIKYQQPMPTNARIVKLKKEGLTFEEIGNRVGMTRQGVHKRLKKHNPELLERDLDERNRQIMEKKNVV